MLKQPVTAVVVNYHGAGHVVAAVQSIRADEPAVQVVVVDNSESAAQVQALRDGLPVEAELIVAPVNLGFGQACNLAVAKAPAAFYWLVNPDARVLPGCLAPLLQALEDDPSLGAVAPLQYLDVGRQWLFSPAWLPTAIDQWVRQRAARPGRDRDRYDRAVRAETLRLWRSHGRGTTLSQRALSGSNLLIRHGCLDPQLGLFDPAYFMYFEDSDLCMRLRRRRWRLAVAPRAQALHLWTLGTYKDDLMQQSRPLYHQRHLADSVWPDRAARLGAPPVRPEADWPTWSAGGWALPEAWQHGWSIEISPTPTFSPCIGRLGSGASVPWPAQVAAAMPGVPLYVRVGPTGEHAGPLASPIMKVIDTHDRVVSPQPAGQRTGA